MKSFKLFCLAFFSCILFTSCGSNQGYAPKSIVNKSLMFVIESTTGSYDKSVKGKKAFYYYHPDGTYESFLDNQLLSYGDYSYNKTGPNTAHITCSYSATEQDIKLTDKNYSYGESITYSTKLVFSDPTHGTWQVTFSSSNHALVDEGGSFTIENISIQGK